MGTIVQSGPIEQIARLLMPVGVATVRLVDRVLLGAFDTLYTWQERARQRHHLAEMSDHMRADLGLNAGDVEREARKPFWHA